MEKYCCFRVVTPLELRLGVKYGLIFYMLHHLLIICLGCLAIAFTVLLWWLACHYTRALRSGWIPLYRGGNGDLRHISSVMIFLWKYGYTFWLLRTQLELNLSPCDGVGQPESTCDHSTVFGFGLSSSLIFLLMTDDPWTANGASDTHKRVKRKCTLSSPKIYALTKMHTVTNTHTPKTKAPSWALVVFQSVLLG